MTGQLSGFKIQQYLGTFTVACPNNENKESYCNDIIAKDNKYPDIPYAVSLYCNQMN